MGGVKAGRKWLKKKKKLGLFFIYGWDREECQEISERETG